VIAAAIAKNNKMKVPLSISRISRVKAAIPQRVIDSTAPVSGRYRLTVKETRYEVVL